MGLPRPEERVSVDLEIRVWGLGADGRVFSQRARAHNISAAGALLCGIERDLKIGGTIGVRTGEKKARCKVVWMMKRVAPERSFTRRDTYTTGAMIQWSSLKKQKARAEILPRVFNAGT